jgi:hypothetical protein
MSDSEEENERSGNEALSPLSRLLVKDFKSNEEDQLDSLPNHQRYALGPDMLTGFPIKAPVVTEVFRWIIRDWKSLLRSSTSDQLVVSDKFLCGGFHWQLSYYPTGSNSPRSSPNHSALYLSCLDLPESSFLTSAFALGIVVDGEPKHSRSQDHRLKNRLLNTNSTDLVKLLRVGATLISYRMN